MGTIVGQLREYRMGRPLEERRALYGSAFSPEDVRRRQLASLNAVWQRACVETAHYGALRRTHSLPTRFASLEEYSSSLPVISRVDVQQRGDAMVSTVRPPDYFRVTGGSTAQPIKLPAWRTEAEHTMYDMWAARGWFGISPRDRCFLLWGHSHLFGTGPMAHVRRISRQLKDTLVGYRRFSTYELDDFRLRQAAETLLAFRPDYVVGASVALAMLAEANQGLSDRLRALRLKAVIATAESFPTPESRALVSEVFGCPVAMEYGCIETGVLAHTVPSGGYRTLWHSHLVEALPGEHGHRVVVTSLYPRAFPLFRYDVGDLIDENLQVQPDRCGVLEFTELGGRSNAPISLHSGRTVHPGAFSQAIREVPGVAAFQVLVSKESAPRVLVVMSGGSHEAATGAIRARLERLDASLASIEVLVSDHLRETRAGKRPMVFVEPT